MTTLKQVLLQEKQIGLVNGHITQQTVWVNDRPDLKIGVYITLKNSDDPEQFWEVTNISKMSIQSYDINQGWNNNI